LLQALFFIILIVSITKTFGENDYTPTQSIEDTEDEAIYSNHKYFDDDSMGSIQKCNISIIAITF